MNNQPDVTTRCKRCNEEFNIKDALIVKIDACLYCTHCGGAIKFGEVDSLEFTMYILGELRQE